MMKKEYWNYIKHAIYVNNSNSNFSSKPFLCYSQHLSENFHFLLLLIRFEKYLAQDSLFGKVHVSMTAS